MLRTCCKNRHLMAWAVTDGFLVQVWWNTPTIPTISNLRQEKFEFKLVLGNKSCLGGLAWRVGSEQEADP